ncbi:uncharacterized protein PHALS_07163 [Plasmopara halstedii]|uniref:Uncharacterized protein n=1 Tax=Plasmopara halstedii TaxID=4781 RepID=A0A0P1B4Y9_PLAHL|nr:uncharacterized protein PHALS_07163 [Plasmopara halstedii]CEG49399.1 hypothetical protein PHALS_07163 [Plasmopara halstedii]|eukprot:XP_024585768.1 hypothetical protein PHALS_07163 [Plasmopara halstedii]
MASIAASPVYPESLKKRSRHVESFDLSRKRQRRGVNDGNSQDEDADVAKYSQRHVEYFEQMKLAEMNRIKTEYDQFLMKKDVEIQRLGQELHYTQERIALQDNDMARLQSENRLLKRAVAIQNQQKEEVQNENQALKQLATQAAEHIKRLEQANYTLRVHLQTSTSTTIGHHQQPPDVY